MTGPTLHMPGEGENFAMGGSRFSTDMFYVLEENGGPPDPATIGELASRHDFEVV